MTDGTNDMVETEEEQQEQETGRGLRAQLEKVLAENKALKAAKLTSSFESIGLDVNTGFGKAIAQTYSGDPSLEAVTEYASQEFGYTAPELSHPAAPQIAQGQSQIDQLGQVTTPVVPQRSFGEKLGEAEAGHDYETTSRLKAAQMEQIMARQNRP